jgi:hypothetical protein
MRQFVLGYSELVGFAGLYDELTPLALSDSA